MKPDAGPPADVERLVQQLDGLRRRPSREGNPAR